jgi:hypothetical protein
MKRMMARFGIRSALGMLVAVAALSAPAIASAATGPAAVRPAVVNQGNFSTSSTSTDGSTTRTPEYVSRSTASTCVDAVHLTGSWSFKLIWLNGGKNTVKFTSRDFTSPGIHCSPTETVTAGAPKFYDTITTTGELSGASGNFSITTNE